MSFFHIRTLPWHPWPLVPDAAFCQVWNAYLELDRIQWLAPAEIEEQLLEQLRVLLSHCIQFVPYYREVLSAARVVPGAIRTMADFRRLPLLPRRVYQDKTATFVAQQLPRGTAAADSVQTSGSSGSPTTVFQTNMTNLWWHAFYLRDLEWCGIDPTGTLASIRSFGFLGPQLQQALQGTTFPFWSAALDPLLETGLTHAMEIRQDHRVQLQWLRRIAPDYLLTYPANLEVLAHLVRAEGPLPSLKAIKSISDTLAPETQATIEAAFGVPVKNTYSCAEAGYLASPCPQGHGLHVHAENVLLEVLDDAGQPCRPGQTGKVYITHLHNLRGPFVRYELGDQATVGPERCPCGRGLPVLTQVHGKRYPLFRLPDGRQKSSVTVALLIRKIGGHRQHQVIQKAVDHAVVRLIVDADWSPSHVEQVRQALQTFFEAPIRVDVEIVTELAMPVSGKFQSMINELR